MNQREAFEAWFEREYVNHNFGYSKLDMFTAWKAALASQWQPIETAPKDGTEVLAKVYGFKPARAKFHDAFGWWSIDGDSPSDDWFCGNLTYEPTHWMPLPPSP